MSREYPSPPELSALGEEPRALLFALLDLAVGVNAVGNAAARAIGINQTDLICLNVLFQRGPTSAGELAATVGLTTGATTTVIDRLERGGYARREADPADRRRVLVAAEPEAAWRAFASFDGLMASLAEFAAAYPAEQLTSFAGLLADFRARLESFTTDLRTPGASDPRAPGAGGLRAPGAGDPRAPGAGG